MYNPKYNPNKIYAMAVLSMILGMVALSLFFKFFVASIAARQFILVWSLLGACFAPIGRNKEWVYWAWSPLLGLCRFISGILVKLFV